MLTADFSGPRFVERAKSITARMPLYDEGTSVSPPTSGTYSLYDANGAVILTGAITVPASGSFAGIASYSILAAALPSTLTLSDRWLEEWALTMPDGSVETVRRDVYLCLRTLYPVVSEKMLEGRVRDLQSLKAQSAASFSTYIEEAWAEVESRLIQAGKRPFLITNAWALRSLHMELTLAYIFEDAAIYMADGGRYEARAKQAHEAAKQAWESLQLEYDDSQSGDRGETTTAAGPAVIYTNRPPTWTTTGWRS